MSWAELNSPQQAFGSRGKSYPQAEPISGDVFLDKLTLSERADLLYLLTLLRLAASGSLSSINVAAVGSVLVPGDHHDIDLICCSEPIEHRHRLPNIVTVLAYEKYFIVGPRASIESESGLILPFKFFAFSRQNFNAFDVSFVSNYSGSWDDVIDFHNRTKLPYCDISKVV